MKKDRKPAMLLVLLVVIAVITCVKLRKNVDIKTLTVTDADGTTYLAVVDQNNNVYAGVTDEDGILYGAVIDENGRVVTDTSMYYAGEYTGTFPVNNTTVVSINQSNANENIDFAGAEVSRVEETTKNTQNKEKPTHTDNDDNSKPTADSEIKDDNRSLLGEKYQKLFESGTYVMTFTTDDPDMPYEITTAFKNGNLYFDTTVEGMACQVIYRADKKEGYMVIPSIRTYCMMPEDMVADMSATMVGAEEASEGYIDVDVYDVVIGDRTCVAEDYKYKDGSNKIYYFYNEQLVRMDFIDEDGTSTVYSISSISSDVPDSYFQLPKGYMKINLSWLMEQMGEETE